MREKFEYLFILLGVISMHKSKHGWGWFVKSEVHCKLPMKKKRMKESQNEKNGRKKKEKRKTKRKERRTEKKNKESVENPKLEQN